jgi:hypothetical protein
VTGVTRYRPWRDPIPLGIAAALLATGIALEVAALRSRPARPPGEVDLATTGPRGAGWSSMVGRCLCGIESGIDAAALEAIQEGVLASVPLPVADQRRRLALRGLGGVMLEQWGYSRLLYDAGLRPAEAVAWQVELDSSRGVEAAALLVDEEEARRYARALFEAWDLAWLELERKVPADVAPADQAPLSRYLLGP